MSAPEVLRGDDVYDEKVDVYSFGVVLNEIWSRQPPYVEVASSKLQKIRCVKNAEKGDKNEDGGGGDDSFQTGGMDAVIIGNPQVYANIHRMKIGFQTQQRFAALPHQVCFSNRRPVVVDNTPPRLRRLIERCWDNLASQRPTMREVVRELQHIIMLVEGNITEGKLQEEDEALKKKKDNKNISKKKLNKKGGEEKAVMRVINKDMSFNLNNSGYSEIVEWLDNVSSGKEETKFRNARGLIHNKMNNYLGSINTDYEKFD
jgi:serine/threonine protein kinase